MGFELIKPGTKIRFMGMKWIFITISCILMLASIVSLAVFGLNLGVDFKGGTKLLIAFKGGEDVDRDMIRKAVVDKFNELYHGEETPQVEVQDYISTDEKEARRYIVYTEVVEVLTATEKEAITGALLQRFGEDTVVNAPAEGGDQFFITFAKEAPIGDRLKEIDELFKGQNVERFAVESDKVRDLNLEFYKEANLAATESDSPDKVLEAVEAEEAFKARVEEFKKTNTDMSYTVKLEQLTAKLEEGIKAVPELGGRFMAIESSTSVSPGVGSDLFSQGLLALLYACLGILLYVALRFDFKYGPGAVIALVHDALLTVGAFSIIQAPFGLVVVAAVLTIIGYSVNDTIVIFDRIRENVEKLKGLPLEKIIDISVNEMLGRTLLTNMTVLFTVLSIFLIGGGAVRDFAFAMVIGAIVGTYSSVFIAGPILVWLNNLATRGQKLAA
jgi:preprotein translocase subunit SecF